jgi:hypothetical protein
VKTDSVSMARLKMTLDQLVLVRIQARQLL